MFFRRRNTIDADGADTAAVANAPAATTADAAAEAVADLSVSDHPQHSSAHHGHHHHHSHHRRRHSDRRKSSGPGGDLDVDDDDNPRFVPNFSRWPDAVRDAAASAADIDPLLNLSDDQRAAAKAVQDALVQDVFPNLSGTPLPEETEWADTRCILRYLRAAKWDVPGATARLRATLQWRREYRPTEISADEVEPEALTGKEFLSGFDRQGRPLFFMVPARENTRAHDRQLRFVVYNMERACALMPPGVEQVALVVDYENVSVMSSPPPSVAAKFLDILGSHYPERLGLAVVVNPSWYLW
ncbi:hypothetical protein HK405_000836, partial [Cladochytrium tenue]